MAIKKEDFEGALAELRKQEEAKHKKVGFNQTVDLIVNLRSFDLKKNPINLAITLPHKVKDKKIAGFLEKKSEVVDTITKAEFDSYTEKKKLKKLIKEYDFFVANAKLMPAVATSFGRVLGPAGKMPSPQIGVLASEDADSIKKLNERIGFIAKVRPKEPSIKIAIGKQDSKDSEIAENAEIIFNKIFEILPKGKENLKSVLIKFTMSKPVKVGGGQE